MRGVLTLALALVAVGCDGCGVSVGGSGVPAAIASFAGHREVDPFLGWSVPGVDLYRLSFAMPDRSSSTVVGLDRASGRVVEGTALMARIGAASPEVLAQRAIDVLLGHQGASALRPSDRSSLGSDAEWALVTPPRVEGEALVFFAWRGEMAPELVEHRMHRAHFTLTTRSVADALVASGQRVAVGGLRCLPRQTCGCWSGCAAFQLVRVPDREDDAPLFVVPGEEDSGFYTPQRDCLTRGGRETCARTCRADALDADCDDALAREGEGCGEACPPTEAPYRCELYEEGCRRIEHPTRSAAASSAASPR